MNTAWFLTRYRYWKLKLHNIRLRNIRSYVSETIQFPDGKVLLWGDIGSGKSSVLHAIDFALFGLQRDDLAGASLLRNGTESGSVELEFSIDGKTHVIKRTLKRAKTGIVQDAGEISFNGKREEKTPVELRQAVLDLLQYPKDLVTKNKTLIYRYTVYTPQEEMKRILLGSKEERLDTLRKVFGVDKYKRIRENTKMLIADLREKKRMYEGATSDLPDKMTEKERVAAESRALEEKRAAFTPRIDTATMAVAEAKEQIVLLENQREEVLRLKKERSLTELDLQHKTEASQKNHLRLEELRKEIIVLESEQLEPKEDLKETIRACDGQLVTHEGLLREVLNKMQEFQTRKAHAFHIQQKIESLSICPTCFQEVSPMYKQTVVERSIAEQQSHNTEITVLGGRQTVLDQEIKQLRSARDLLRQQESEVTIVRMKLLNLQGKKSDFIMVEEQNRELENMIVALQQQLTDLDKQVATFTDLDTRYTVAKLAVDTAVAALQSFLVEKARMDSSFDHLALLLESLTRDIEKKLVLREKKETITQTQFWLSDFFIPLMETMEKNILYRVHADFNALFEKWFLILIDTQALHMSLDEEYTPRILQNGYDIEYEYLSGGEKTAGAFAYRLALNQVINTLNTGIKTSDLLILDEPTDGFSSEQLDRLKLLMDEIRIPQIIMVSHESQIECFADHILRFEKREHVTRVVA